VITATTDRKTEEERTTPNLQKSVKNKAVKNIPYERKRFSEF
jgi:hypothetical protein